MPKITKQHPFTGKKIYYSGSMSGVPEKDLQFPEQLIQYMKKNGAKVLDEHVAIPHKYDQMIQLLVKGHGITVAEWNALEEREQDLKIYEHDIRLVNEATHVVALLNGISMGVGMELQEALRKPERGLSQTPILGLFHQEFAIKVSRMIKGAAQKYPHFHLKAYDSLEEAQDHLHKFLLNFN
jgi:hypothetical protein